MNNQQLVRKLYIEAATQMHAAYTFKEIADLFFQYGIIDRPEKPYGTFQGSKYDYILEKLSNTKDISGFLDGMIGEVVFELEYIRDGGSCGHLGMILIELGYIKTEDPNEPSIHYFIPPKEAMIKLNSNTRGRNDRYYHELHPKIKKVSEKLMEQGFFKEAIQNAFVEVIDTVKTELNNPQSSSGRDLDGDDLMNKVFGCDNEQQPIIKLNDLKTGLDKAEQRGLMYLFKGIVGIRNKKAHLNYIQNNPKKTYEYLSLASLLMRILDDHFKHE